MAYFSGKANGDEQMCDDLLAYRHTIGASIGGVGLRANRNSGRNGSAIGAEIPSIALEWFAVHFAEGMFVQQVWFDAAELLTIVDLNSDVIVERTNWRSLVEKNIFCSLKDL